ncbi:MAG: DnaJ domain-containing protein [Flavonifractor plautii]
MLGVKPDASDEEIKRAYRELARKYHPDNYQNNPLADLAEEKMKEINEAYDTITKMRSGGGASGGYQSQGAYRGSYQGGYQQQYSSASSGSLYNQERQAINMGDIGRSQSSSLRGAAMDAGGTSSPGPSPTARAGWTRPPTFPDGPCSMDPAREYRQALMMMRQGGQAYRPTATAVGSTPATAVRPACA